MQQTTPKKTILDADLVNAVVAATTEVLATMASTDVVLQKMEACQDYKPSGDISGIIGMTSDEGEGMFALAFSRSTANILVSRLVGVSPESVSTDDRCDGVGELVNMIGGHAKAALSKSLGSIYKLTLPTVIQGSDHQISSRPKNNPYLVLVFEAEGERFSLQVSFKQY
jgi:CheY-specific phosphatase CheX